MLKKKKLNKRELDVLEVLWNTDKSLSANEIADISEISKKIVLPVLKQLLNKKYIEVEDTILIGKTLARKYRSTLDKEEFILSYYDLNVDNLLSHFLSKEKDPDVIPNIEKLIEEKKSQLKEDENQ